VSTPHIFHEINYLCQIRLFEAFALPPSTPFGGIESEWLLIGRGVGDPRPAGSWIASAV
jgi:hypothetical protein